MSKLKVGDKVKVLNDPVYISSRKERFSKMHVCMMFPEHMIGMTGTVDEISHAPSAAWVKLKETGIAYLPEDLEKVSTRNIIEIDYCTIDKETVVITAIRNLLTPRGIDERYGPIVSELYAKSRYRIHRGGIGEVVFKPIIFSKEPRLRIPFLPHRTDRLTFNKMIQYMKAAGDCLVQAIRRAKEIEASVKADIQGKKIKTVII